MEASRLYVSSANPFYADPEQSEFTKAFHLCRVSTDFFVCFKLFNLSVILITFWRMICTHECNWHWIVMHNWLLEMVIRLWFDVYNAFLQCPFLVMCARRSHAFNRNDKLPISEAHLLWRNMTIKFNAPRQNTKNLPTSFSNSWLTQLSNSCFHWSDIEADKSSLVKMRADSVCVTCFVLHCVLHWLTLKDVPWVSKPSIGCSNRFFSLSLLCLYFIDMLFLFLSIRGWWMGSAAWEDSEDTRIGQRLVWYGVWRYCNWPVRRSAENKSCYQGAGRTYLAIIVTWLIIPSWIKFGFWRT